MKQPSFVDWLLFAALSLIWGSSFILIKLGMHELSPSTVASLRIASGALVLLPFVFRALKRIPGRLLPFVALSGLLGNLLPSFLFCHAETKISSALTGILNALTPLCTIVLGIVIFKAPFIRQKMIGVLLGFVGLCVLTLSRGRIGFDNLGYSLLVVLATLCYGFNTNMFNRYLKSVNSLDIASVSLAFMLLPSIGVLWSEGFFARPAYDAAFFQSTGASVILGILGTGLATVLFVTLVKRAGPVFGSMVTYGIPFVALGWAAIAGEEILLLQMLCLLLILAGVYIAQRTKATGQ